MPRGAIKVEVRGFTGISRRLQTRLNRYERDRRNIFASPLRRTITNIRRQLTQDSATGFNHVFTGEMYSNTRYEYDATSLEETNIYFGFFVPYGMHFEVGGRPKFLPLSVLNPWATHRFGSSAPAAAIQRSIARRGTRGYGIITRVWQGNQDNYLNIVHRRFWRVWA